MDHNNSEHKIEENTEENQEKESQNKKSRVRTVGSVFLVLVTLIAFSAMLAGVFYPRVVEVEKESVNVEAVKEEILSLETSDTERLNELLSRLYSVPSEIERKEEHAEQPGFLNLSMNLMFWTLITFGIVVGVLSRFVWEPILKALDYRKLYIQRQIEVAETREKKSKEIFDKQKEILEETREKAEGFIKKAETESEKIKNKYIEKAERESHEIQEKNRREIERAKQKILNDIKNEISRTAIFIAGQIIQKTLSSKDHEELIVQALKEYQNVKQNHHERHDSSESVS